MFVLHDRSKCVGMGICESLAPEYFEIADDGSLLLLRDEVSAEDHAAVAEAVRSCPTSALQLGDERA